MEYKHSFPIVEFTDNFDGDTIYAVLDLGFGVLYEAMVSLDRVNTPELRGGTEATKELAKKVKQHVREFLWDRGSLMVVSNTRGKRGRIEGDILYDGESLSDHLLGANMAIPTGARKRGQTHEHNAKFHGY